MEVERGEVQATQPLQIHNFYTSIIGITTQSGVEGNCVKRLAAAEEFKGEV